MNNDIDYGQRCIATSEYVKLRVGEWVSDHEIEKYLHGRYGKRTRSSLIHTAMKCLLLGAGFTMIGNKIRYSH